MAQRRSVPATAVLLTAVIAASSPVAGSQALVVDPDDEVEIIEPAVPLDAPNLVGEPVDLVGASVDLFGEVASLYGEIDGLTVIEGADGTEIRTAADVLFDFDSAELGGDAQALLDELAEVLARAAPDRVVVEGHTDGIGDAAYNARLSLERAERVAAYLESEGGLSGTAFEPVGRGSEDPIAAETDEDGEDLPEGRARNRRVTLLFDP